MLLIEIYIISITNHITVSFHFYRRNTFFPEVLTDFFIYVHCKPFTCADLPINLSSPTFWGVLCEPTLSQHSRLANGPVRHPCGVMCIQRRTRYIWEEDKKWARPPANMLGEKGRLMCNAAYATRLTKSFRKHPYYHSEIFATYETHTGTCSAMAYLESPTKS